MASLLAALASARAVREVSGSGLFQKPVRSERRLSRRLIGPHVDEAGASSPTEFDFDSVAAGAALLTFGEEYVTVPDRKKMKDDVYRRAHYFFVTCGHTILTGSR